MILKYNFNLNLYGAVVTICFLNISLGSAVTWSSSVIPKLLDPTETPFNQLVSKTQTSTIVSLLTVGACLGACLFGCLVDTIGRRYTLILAGTPMLISYIMMTQFKDPYLFYAARFIMGFSVGATNLVNGTYISEICSKSNRGTILALSGAMITLGNFFGYLVGPWVSVTTFHIILTITPLLSIIFAFIFCKETPYYYLLKNRDELAAQSLLIYRGMDIKVEEEIAEIKAKIDEQRKGSILEVMKTHAFIKSFIIGNMILILQQLSGITAIIMFSETIFKKTSSNLSSPICSIIFGSIQFSSACMMSFIADRLNRKTFLAISVAGMSISELILGVYFILEDGNVNLESFKFLPVVALSMCIFSYNFGMGTLGWAILGEIFATRVKAFAMSFSVFVYNVLGTIILQYFNALADAIGIGEMFLMFSAICFGTIFFILFYVIETRGKTLEEIQDELEK